MSFLIVLAALAFLMLAAYRGYSVILFAPVAALGAVLLTDASAVAPVFSGIFMEKMVGFIKLYFPVFLLGAVFGKLIEMSGFSQSIVVAAIRYIGRSRANAVIVAVCGALTYGGVSLFVVVFAVYPFAAELYRQSNIPKRLMPGAIALGAFTFTMDTLPGTPQIQNIIPTTFFQTTGWAAPWLGTIGAVLTVGAGLAYLEWRRRSVMASGEGYGSDTQPVAQADPASLPSPLLSVAPLVLVGVANFLLSHWIPVWYGASHVITSDELPGLHAPVTTSINAVVGISGRRLAAGDLAGLRYRVQAHQGGLCRRHERGGRRRLAGGHEHGLGIRFRRRDRRAARFYRGARRAAQRARSAG